MNTKWFMVVICLLLTAKSFSQDDKEKVQLKDTIKLNEVIISANKVAVSKNNVPYTVSLVNRQEIEQSSESALLPVLSEQVPGLFVTEKGVTGFGVSTGSAGQISIRGVGGSPNTQVLVLLNGSPQFMGIMGHPLPDSYVASDVEKVEIIRGPASTLYGSNAMGGVINIITREQQNDGFNANAHVMYGSYNTQKYMVNGGFKKNKFNVFLSLNHDQTNGHRDSSDFSIYNGYIKTGYEISKHFNFSADYSIAKFNASDPGSETGNAGNKIDILRGMGAFSFVNKFEKYEGALRLFYNYGEHTITDGFHSLDKNYGITLNEAFKLFKGNILTAGVDYKTYGGIAENTKAMNGKGIIFGDTMNYETGVYLLMQQEIKEKLTLNAGLRYEFSDVYGNEPIPTIGLAYRLTPTTAFKVSVAKGFRSPTIRELYLWSVANKDLEPEKMMNYEIGINKYLFSNKLNIDASIYKSEGSNMIQTAMINNVPMYMNSGKFSNTGFDFGSKFRINKSLNIFLNYSYIHMDELIASMPEQQICMGATWKIKKFTFGLNSQYIMNLVLVTLPEVKKENYLIVNARVNYDFNKYFGAFIKGENLLNQSYQINYDYPMPGIGLFGGINFHL